MWQCLLGLLRSAVPAISGAQDFFTRLHHALRLATGRRISITSAILDELNLWRHLVASLAERLTYLREIRAQQAHMDRGYRRIPRRDGKRMPQQHRGMACLDISVGQRHQAPPPHERQPSGNRITNDLGPAAYVANLHLFVPKTAHLEHIHTLVDNTAAEGWDRRGSVSLATYVGTLLHEAAWITRQTHIHASFKRITGLNSHESDATSRLTHLPVRDFLKHFHSTLPQPSPWRMFLLPSAAK